MGSSTNSCFFLSLLPLTDVSLFVTLAELLAAVVDLAGDFVAILAVEDFSAGGFALVEMATALLADADFDFAASFFVATGLVVLLFAGGADGAFDGFAFAAFAAGFAAAGFDLEPDFALLICGLP